MSDQLTLGDRKVSSYLSSLLKTAAEQITDFTNSWSEIVSKGKEEGFNEKELIEIIRPLVKQQLDGYGLTTKAVNNKIYYLVHRDELNQRAIDRQKGLKFKPSETEVPQVDISMNDENARLRTENNELHEIIEKQAFNDNPDVFCVRKDSDNYFARISVREIAGLLSGMFSDNGTKVNFAFEEVKE